MFEVRTPQEHWLCPKVMLKKDLPQWQLGLRARKPPDQSLKVLTSIRSRDQGIPREPNPLGPCCETQLLTWIRAPAYSSAVSSPDDLLGSADARDFMELNHLKEFPVLPLQHVEGWIFLKIILICRVKYNEPRKHMIVRGVFQIIQTAWLS